MYVVPWVVALILLAIDRARQPSPDGRSPYRAAAASLFIPGLGQLYNGEVRKVRMVWAAGLVVVLVVSLTGAMERFWGMVLVMVLGAALVFGALVDAVRTARSLESYTPKSFNRWFVYVGVFAVVALAGFPRSMIDAKALRIPSESNQPTLRVGDLIMARLETPESYKNHRGDILVFKYPGDNKTMYIKRVIALPGETVEIRGTSLLVNGQPIAESWARLIEASIKDYDLDFGPFRVPDQTLFVLGDNLANSADSRHWGPLKRENIIGVASFIYFSWDPHNNRVRFNRIGRDVRS